MHVIKPGMRRDNWAMRLECTGANNGGRGCHAILLVEEDDLFFTYGGEMGEDVRFVTFECCQCATLTDVSNCPPFVEDGIRARVNAAKKQKRATDD